MSYVYKELKQSNITYEVLETNKKFIISGSSNLLNSYQYRSGSLESDGLTPTLSGSYWNSLLMDFYLSGSELSTIETKYNDNHNSFTLKNPRYPQHISKFNTSGSIISIPQSIFGESIKRKTFELVDNNYTSSVGKNVIIKDDGYGNLYSTNASVSSSDTSPSSSDNYIGNIFYNVGVVTLTETGSWSGSISYASLTSTNNYTASFESINTIVTAEYLMDVEPYEFNSTNNPTAKEYIEPEGTLSSEYHNSPDNIDGSTYKSNLISSNFRPYVTTIGFFRQFSEGFIDREPVMVAKLSQPVKLRNDISLQFRVKIDW